MPSESSTDRFCCFCGCTPEHSCRVPGGDECSYVYWSRTTRCTAPGCMAAFDAMRRADFEEDSRRRKMFANLRHRKSTRRGRAA
jgi:hypothetical protein